MTIYPITEGIILKSIPYEEQKQILSVYTPLGLLSVMNHVSPKKPSLSPLTLGEFSLKKNRSSWFTLYELKSLDYFFPLRSSYPHLSAATECIKALLTSQMPDKPSPKLFSLFKAYLHHFMEFDTPSILTTSFLLKILRHDGLIDLSPRCLKCLSKNLVGLHGGSFLCETCIPLKINHLDKSAIEDLILLGLGQDFSLFQSVPDASTYPFVSALFSELTLN